MKKFFEYLRDSYREFTEKVSWPTWPQLTQSTAIVLGATFIITLIVWVMDIASSTSLDFIYSLFK